MNITESGVLQISEKKSLVYYVKQGSGQERKTRKKQKKNLGDLQQGQCFQEKKKSKEKPGCLSIKIAPLEIKMRHGAMQTIQFSNPCNKM